MSATIHTLPVPVPRATCTKCGTEATCDCNAAYVPARERAAAALVVTPEKSNRAIAAEIGVSEPTVRRARASCDAPATVTGLDGKEYPAQRAAPPEPSPSKSDDSDDDDFEERTFEEWTEDVKQLGSLDFFANALLSEFNERFSKEAKRGEVLASLAANLRKSARGMNKLAKALEDWAS